MVLDAVLSLHTRRNYAQALDLLFTFAANRPLTRALLMEYRSLIEDQASSTVNVRLAAGRKLVTEARRNGMRSDEEAANLTKISNVRQQGTRPSFGLLIPVLVLSPNKLDLQCRATAFFGLTK